MLTRWILIGGILMLMLEPHALFKLTTGKPAELLRHSRRLSDIPEMFSEEYWKERVKEEVKRQIRRHLPF